MYRIQIPKRQRNFKVIYKNIEAIGKDGTFQVKNGKITKVKNETLHNRELEMKAFNKIITLTEALNKFGTYVYYTDLEIALIQKALWLKELYEEIDKEIEKIKKNSDKILKNCSSFLEAYPEIMF